MLLKLVPCLLLLLLLEASAGSSKRLKYSGKDLESILLGHEPRDGNYYINKLKYFKPEKVNLKSSVKYPKDSAESSLRQYTKNFKKIQQEQSPKVRQEHSHPKKQRNKRSQSINKHHKDQYYSDIAEKTTCKSTKYSVSKASFKASTTRVKETTSLNTNYESDSEIIKTSFGHDASRQSTDLPKMSGELFEQTDEEHCIKLDEYTKVDGTVLKTITITSTAVRTITVVKVMQTVTKVQPSSTAIKINLYEFSETSKTSNDRPTLTETVPEIVYSIEDQSVNEISSKAVEVLVTLVSDIVLYYENGEDLDSPTNAPISLRSDVGGMYRMTRPADFEHVNADQVLLTVTKIITETIE